MPADDFGADLSVANAAAVAWCQEINAVKHSETQAVPAQRLVVERDVLRTLPSLRLEGRRGVGRKVDKLSTVRMGSARYSVPHQLVGKQVDVSTCDDLIDVWHDGQRVASHRLVPPGATSILDEHYDRPAGKPRRAVRPRTKVEVAFLGLGETAEAFLRAAATAGTSRLAAHLADIVALENCTVPATASLAGAAGNDPMGRSMIAAAGAWPVDGISERRIERIRPEGSPQGHRISYTSRASRYV